MFDFIFFSSIIADDINRLFVNSDFKHIAYLFIFYDCLSHRRIHRWLHPSLLITYSIFYITYLIYSSNNVILSVVSSLNWYLDKIILLSVKFFNAPVNDSTNQTVLLHPKNKCHYIFHTNFSSSGVALYLLVSTVSIKHIWSSHMFCPCYDASSSVTYLSVDATS